MVVIPARWNSSRLPGKPLVPIAGHTLLARTVDLARRATAGLDGVTLLVATDDARIEAAAASLGCAVERTPAELTSGTARVAAACRLRRPAPEFVVNLQGDAPFIPADALREVIAALAAGARVATPVVRLDWPALDALRRHKLDAPFSGTTCIAGDDSVARWFSKAIIPAIRDEKAARRTGEPSPVMRHVGLYGYDREALNAFDAAPPGRYERLEGLEQLRFFDLNIPITVVPVAPAEIDMGGIDTPEDVALAERLLAARRGSGAG